MTHARAASLRASPQGPIRTLRLAVEEARPAVQIIFMIRFFCGALLATGLGVELRPARIVLGASAWYSATVCVYLYNGVCDVHGDRINGSKRPIASGRLPLTTARVQVVLFGLTAIALGLVQGPLATCAVGAMLVLGWLYSVPAVALKNTTHGAGAGVLLMGLLTYASGFLSVPVGAVALPLVVFAVAMSLWMGLVGAVVKDFSDPDGDLAEGRQTLASTGRGRLARVAASGSAIAIGAGLLVAARFVPLLLLPAAATTIGAIVVAAFCLVPALSRWASRLRPGMRARSVARIPYRAFMVTQYVVHLGLMGVILS